MRHSVLRLAAAALALAVLSPAALAQIRSSVRGGADLNGPIKTKRCNAGAVCRLEVRAALGPVDEDAEAAGQRECIIRVPVSMAVRPATTTLRWQLSVKSQERGFTFRPPGVTIDDDGDASTPPIFGTPALKDSDTAVEVDLTAEKYTSASSYTLWLKYKRPNGVLTFDCEGYDPLIVSRD